MKSYERRRFIGRRLGGGDGRGVGLGRNGCRCYGCASGGGGGLGGGDRRSHQFAIGSGRLTRVWGVKRVVNISWLSEGLVEGEDGG